MKKISTDSAVATEQAVKALEESVGALAELDERRATALAARDSAILACRKAGVSWTKIQTLAQLSPRGLQLALRRVGGLDASASRPD